jgi:hypothetical protein
MDKLAAADIDVPAAAFKSSGSERMVTASRGRKVRIPSERELADREALR